MANDKKESVGVKRASAGGVPTGRGGAKALMVPDNITLLPLPPYSPELNPVERLWAYLKSHYLSNRVYTHYNHLLDETTKVWNQLTHDHFKSICNVIWIRREI
jgi:transposase